MKEGRKEGRCRKKDEGRKGTNEVRKEGRITHHVLYIMYCTRGKLIGHKTLLVAFRSHKLVNQLIWGQLPATTAGQMANGCLALFCCEIGGAVFGLEVKPSGHPIRPNCHSPQIVSLAVSMLLSIRPSRASLVLYFDGHILVWHRDHSSKSVISEKKMTLLLVF